MVDRPGTCRVIPSGPGRSGRGRAYGGEARIEKVREKRDIDRSLHAEKTALAYLAALARTMLTRPWFDSAGININNVYQEEKDKSQKESLDVHEEDNQTSWKFENQSMWKNLSLETETAISLLDFCLVKYQYQAVADAILVAVDQLTILITVQRDPSVRSPDPTMDSNRHPLVVAHLIQHLLAYYRSNCLGKVTNTSDSFFMEYERVAASPLSSLGITVKDSKYGSGTSSSSLPMIGLSSGEEVIQASWLELYARAINVKYQLLLADSKDQEAESDGDVVIGYRLSQILIPAIRERLLAFIERDDRNLAKILKSSAPRVFSSSTSSTTPSLDAYDYLKRFYV